MEREELEMERERWEVGGRRIIALTYGVHMVPLVSQNLAL